MGSSEGASDSFTQCQGRSSCSVPKHNLSPQSQSLSPKANPAKSCWVKGFSAELCCKPPSGMWTCFDGIEFTYELCCARIVNQTIPLTNVSHAVGRVLPDDNFTVDILIRAFYGEAAMLEVLFESIEI